MKKKHGQRSTDNKDSQDNTYGDLIQTLYGFRREFVGHMRLGPPCFRFFVSGLVCSDVSSPPNSFSIVKP